MIGGEKGSLTPFRQWGEDLVRRGLGQLLRLTAPDLSRSVYVAAIEILWVCSVFFIRSPWAEATSTERLKSGAFDRIELAKPLGAPRSLPHRRSG